MGLKLFFENRKRKNFKKKHKVGLCLSGGGARGFAYIGVFKAFQECGIEFDMVAGASAGALFGSLYASGLSFDVMAEKGKLVKDSDLRSSKIPFMSKMDNLQQKLIDVLPVRKLEDMKIPFHVVAVDLRSGKEIDFSSGDVASIVTGSCAIPGVFVPVKYKNMVLVDGGVSNNVPTDVLRFAGCDYVVSVDCNSTRGGGTESHNIFSQFITSIGIMMATNSKVGLKDSDIVITPDMKRFSSLKIVDRDAMIEEGYKATMKAMPEIKKLFLGQIKKK